MEVSNFNRFRYEHAGYVTTAKTWTKLIGIMLMIVGGSVLAGWALDIVFLKSLLPILAPMRPNTAVGFFLIGTSLWLTQHDQFAAYKRVAQLCAALAFLIGLLTLTQYITGLDLGIDHLLFEDAVSTEANFVVTGRMAEATAIGFVLTGYSLLLLMNTRLLALVQIIALTVTIMGFMAFSSYVFNATSLQKEALFNNITLYTSFALFAAGFAVLLASSNQGFFAIFTQNYMGGLMARRLLPAIVIIPLCFAWLRLQGQQQGLYGAEFGAVFFATCTIVTLSALVWRIARMLNQIDIDSRRLIEHQARLNATRQKIETLVTPLRSLPRYPEPLIDHLLIYPSDEPRRSAPTPTVRTTSSGINGYTLEVRTDHQNNALFDVELNIQPPETSIKEAQARYHAKVHNAAANAIIVTDLDFHIQSWNKIAELIYGWKEADALGKRVHELLKPEFSNSPFDSASLRFALFEDDIWADEVVHYRQDGTPIHILTSAMLFKDEHNQPSYILMVNQDISTRKEAELALRGALEREKEVSNMKTRFVSVASHEFRTPLTNIFMAAETLTNYRHKMQPQQIEEKLNRVREQVRYMVAILDDVIESSKMQNNYVDFKPCDNNMDSVCLEIIQEFREQEAYLDRIQYQSDCHDLVFKFDARLMRQVINNILSNALKYSPSDKKVRVLLVQTQQQVLLEVTDQGIGIPKDDLKHIFEPFYRANNVGKISGTGLGMNITQKAIELHGGKVNIDSEPGIGTTFSVQIPVMAANRPA